MLGYLEDYAAVADGLLALYETGFETRWLEASIELADAMIDLFWDDDVGGFYDTGHDAETLVVRPRDIFDNAQPCGSSLAADLLLKLSVVKGKDDYATRAAGPMRSVNRLMSQAPVSYTHLTLPTKRIV